MAALRTTAGACEAGSWRSCRRRHSPRLRALELVGQFFPALVVRDLEHLGQPGRDLLERVGQVAVLVERIDQHVDRRRILGRQPHAQQLGAQVFFQRQARRGAVLAVEVFVAVAARAGCGRRQLADAVEIVALGAVLPVVALGGAEFGRVHAGRLVGAIGPDARVLGFGLGPLGAGTGAGAGLEAVERQLGRDGLLFRLEERVLFHHLLDLLVQFQGRELQQTDRLLQLWRQRQMLGQADLQRGLHARAYIRKCSPR